MSVEVYAGPGPARSRVTGGATPPRAQSGKPRWHYRLASFSRAYNLLREELDGNVEDLSPLELEGLIRRFGYTFELGWKLLKDRLEHDGATLAAVTPLTVVRAAYEARLVDDGNAWMDMLTDRRRTSRMYDEDVIMGVVERIRDHYLAAFGRLREQSLQEETP